MFDPAKERELLLGDCGFEHWGEKKFEDIRANCALGSNAYYALNTVAPSYLVGLDAQATELLERSLVWVDAAIAEHEIENRYAAGYSEARRYQTQAMCKWLLRSEHDGVAYEQMIYQSDRYLVGEGKKKDPVGISFMLPEYADARAFERALEIFNSVPKLVPPKSPGNIHNEAQMVYVLARHHLGLQYTDNDVALASRKFLLKNMDKWLGRGHGMRAAEWMKILHWNDTDRSLSARQVLMKCYDYLPGRAPPG